MNIINCEGKVKVKFVFTFYFMGFGPVYLELQHIEILCFLQIFQELSAQKTEVRKLPPNICRFEYA